MTGEVIIFPGVRLADRTCKGCGRGFRACKNETLCPRCRGGGEGA